jgi:F-type H+-transporting ATPase subunit b
MQIDWWTLGIQTINFLIVIWLLSRFLYRPIRKIIEEREVADKSASDAAVQKLADAEKIRRTYEEKTAQFARVLADRDAAFHKTLEEDRAKTLEATRKEVAALLEEAHARIALDEQQALDALKQRIGELATSLARTALAEHATGQELLSRMRAHLDKMPRADLDNLKEDLRPSGAALNIVTAQTLPDAEKEGWSAILSERFGAQTRLVFSQDAALLGGAELHFPHAALRFSVSDRLERATQALEV